MRGKITLCFLFLFWLICSPVAFAQPNITGEAAVLVDAKTGEVLWGKEENERRAPASITKLVAAIVALENAELQESVTISQEAVKTSGSIIWLRAGEVQTLENLLYAMMLNSGNDAALAVAYHISETEEEFVGLMNAKAQELGAINTNFVNPNGLSAEGHYSTAYDIALFMMEALENPILREMVGTKTRDWNGMDWQSQLVNLNQLLWQYDGMVGGKTGYTSEAGRCLATAANREGLELVSVVLGSSTQGIWSDMTKILDFGYENYQIVQLVAPNEEIMTIELSGKTIPVLSGASTEYLMDKNSDSAPRWKISLFNLVLPLEEQEIIGKIEFLHETKRIESIPLISGSTIKKPITWVEFYIAITAILLLLFGLALLIKGFNTIRKNRKVYSTRRGSNRYDAQHWQ